LFIIYDLFSDDVGIGYRNNNLTGKAVNETARGILRSGKFPEGTKKMHEFPQENNR